MIKLLIFISFLLSVANTLKFNSFFQTKHQKFGDRSFLLSTTIDPELIPSPGNPKVIGVDTESNKAKIQLTLSPDVTQKAFLKSCELYNEEVDKKNYKIPGFRKGAKLPPNYLYQIFSEESVKGLCSTLLLREIQEECDKTGLNIVGKVNITEFNTIKFQPGNEHTLEVEVELWPDIIYSREEKYKGLEVTVEQDDFDIEKFEKVKTSIKERYKILSKTDSSYEAKLGDVAVVTMKGYEKTADGKGSELPSVAKGDNVEVLLETGKFMGGLVEGIVGAKAGDLREIEVTFPNKPTGAGAALSGKQAIFEITVNEVKTKALPEWNEELAASIREGMTLEELDNEVRTAVNTDRAKSAEAKRNDAIANALLNITTISKIPESLVDENTKTRFQNMLVDFKEQGSTDEQIKEMMTPANYNRYKEISRPNVEKAVKLGLIFRDVATRESIDVSPDEIKQQLDILTSQAKQKNAGPVDEETAKYEIEETMLRLKVFDYLASVAKITYVDKAKTI